VGAQEMIFCPAQDRSVEMIEDLCCLVRTKVKCGYYFQLIKPFIKRIAVTVTLDYWRYTASGVLLQNQAV